ncbi:hypothetical protein V3H18_04075 [Methylocystis sp. 9N]|uniref:DUF3558 domain-containing protein n=1 Tax=Methylocystis borbori TaxID=3118750 RepID=A0ABU7XEB3_9HYPH
MSPILHGAVAVSMAIAAATGGSAVAAEQSVTPLAANDCEAIAGKIGEAAKIPVTTKTGRPDFLTSIRGNACLISGTATGLKAKFLDDVQKRLDATLADWTYIPDFDADGPDSTVKGFSKGSQRLVYALETRPPNGTCGDAPIGDCKVPRQRWTWSLKVAAFVQ